MLGLRKEADMETLAMSDPERRRLEVLGRVRRGEVTLVKASELVGLGYRQMKRLWTRYRQEGDRGVVRISARRWPRSIWRRSTGCRWRWRRCGSGCWQRGCGNGGGDSRRIADAGHARSTAGNWYRWTVPGMTGSRGGGLGQR